MSHTKEINVSDASRVSGQAPKGDYSLELIQMISAAVMALDQNVQQDVLVMRKNLLKYINVKECAAEAEYYLTRSNQVDYSFDAATTVMTTETSIYAATRSLNRETMVMSGSTTWEDISQRADGE
ncbi:unnamed protein product [Brassica rapa]|uniref:Uncharacterized protein n=1 Tax=Brassica campestris TaxID=3711 RepID=A0A8D9D5F8_BRACM|nr:unnamed protein product [Brassica rapa]